MINKIKNKIEKNIPPFLRSLETQYSLKESSPLLFKQISDFVKGNGKRARPILFIIGFMGFSKKIPQGLYTSALSLELLHDFMLGHDDIIDKSPLRRGKPSLHAALNAYLAKYRHIKFTGEDLAIVIGDVMYAMGLDAFLCVKTDPVRKERSFRKFIDAAVYTGCGEFIELLSGIKDISEITKDEVYKIYDFKTACYTFATPLSMGALLAGAQETQSDKLFHYGIYIGRAFQIKDDILGIFGAEDKIGKSVFTDLQEAKKTVLIWLAFRHASRKDKSTIKRILGKEMIRRFDLEAIRGIITRTGALDYAKAEISSLIDQADQSLRSSQMDPRYKKLLFGYTREILSV